MRFGIKTEKLYIWFYWHFHIWILKKLTFTEKSILEILILEVLRSEDFLAFWSCLPESGSMSWWFPAEFYSSGGFLFHELVIPGGIPFLPWLPSSWAGNSQKNYLIYSDTTYCSIRGNYSSDGFLILELVLPGRITLYTVLQRIATFAATGLAACVTINPPNGIGSRIHYSTKFLPPKPIFSNFNMKMAFKWKINLIRP
jgi:hypothetical protein